jgi:hypothetical protein
MVGSLVAEFNMAPQILLDLAVKSLSIRFEIPHVIFNVEVGPLLNLMVKQQI